MFVIDRCAVQLLRTGLTSDGKLPRASYILDLSDLPVDAQCSHSSTGYGDNIKAKYKKSKTTFKRFNAKNCVPSVHVGVKPHLSTHYTLAEGMATLKEALKMLTRYYPELLECIYFYNSPWW